MKKWVYIIATKAVATPYFFCTNCSFCPATAFQGLLVNKSSCHFFLICIKFVLFLFSV